MFSVTLYRIIVERFMAVLICNFFQDFYLFLSVSSEKFHLPQFVCNFTFYFFFHLPRNSNLGHFVDELFSFSNFIFHFMKLNESEY